jgi:hypothetical protein
MLRNYPKKINPSDKMSGKFFNESLAGETEFATLMGDLWLRMDRSEIDTDAWIYTLYRDGLPVRCGKGKTAHHCYKNAEAAVKRLTK